MEKRNIIFLVAFIVVAGIAFYLTDHFQSKQFEALIEIQRDSQYMIKVQTVSQSRGVSIINGTYMAPGSLIDKNNQPWFFFEFLSEGDSIYKSVNSDMMEVVRKGSKELYKYNFE